MRHLWPLLIPSLFAACAADRGLEEEVPAEGKLDSFQRPTDHGAIEFAAAQVGIATADEHHHTWTFTLSGPASIHAFTSRVAHYANMDTVIYLYRFDPARGWGAYIARNDDDGRAHWSSIDRELEAGEYRVLVKGYTAATRGRFNLEVDCDGDGCAAPPSCVFGGTYHDIDTNPNLVVTSAQKLTSPAGLDELTKQRIIIALHQSSHTDVTTIEEAFAAADQSEVNVKRIYEPAAARTYTAIEYGAGDNSYGAIFYWDTTTLVTNIHDGDLENCTVVPEVCLLGTSWNELKTSTEFTRVSSVLVTTASQLSGLAADQALAAIRVAYDDATDLADGLTKIDDGGLNAITFRHASGVTVDVFEYGAGDNSYGEVFHGGTLEVAAEINDLDFYGCSVFQ